MSLKKIIRKYKKAALCGSFFVCIILIFLGYFVIEQINDYRKTKSSRNDIKLQTETHQASPERSKEINILGLGDWLTHDTILNKAKNKGGDGYNFDTLVSDILPAAKNSDAGFCALPQLIAQDKVPAGYPRFNAPREFGSTMKKTGCTMIGGASNHTFDYDQSYIDSSRTTLQEIGLVLSGMNSSKKDQSSVQKINIGETTCGLLSYTTYVNVGSPIKNDYGVNIFSKELVQSHINQLKSDGIKCIFVSMRWGTEFSNQVNAEQKNLATWLVEQGVTVVFGHGSHVVQKIDSMKRPDGGSSVVLYSLGNFINTQIPLDTVTGCIFKVKLDPALLNVKAVKCIPIHNYYSWSPEQAKTENIEARKDFKMILLSKSSTTLFAQQQLNTSPESVRADLSKVFTEGSQRVDIEAQ